MRSFAVWPSRRDAKPCDKSVVKRSEGSVYRENAHDKSCPAERKRWIAWKETFKFYPKKKIQSIHFFFKCQKLALCISSARISWWEFFRIIIIIKGNACNPCRKKKYTTLDRNRKKKNTSSAKGVKKPPHFQHNMAWMKGFGMENLNGLFLKATSLLNVATHLLWQEKNSLAGNWVRFIKFRLSFKTRLRRESGDDWWWCPWFSLFIFGLFFTEF